MTVRRSSSRSLLARTAAIAVLVWTGCSGGGAAQPIVVEGPTSGGSASVALSAGDVLEVRLRGNATTGYAWAVVPPVPPCLVQQGDAAYVEDANPEHLVGIGGTWVFRFEVVERGTATLSFAYARPGETVPPAQTFDVQVQIR